MWQVRLCDLHSGRGPAVPLHQEECKFDSDTADLPQFDMGCLENPLEWASLGWKEKITAFIQSKATFVSLLVLAIEGARFLTFVFLLIQTVVLHGSKTAKPSPTQFSVGSADNPRKLSDKINGS